MSVHYQTSKQSDGPMGRSSDLTPEAAARRAAFVRNVLNRDPECMVAAGLVHGTRVMPVTTPLQEPRFVPQCDGLLTDQPSIVLIITTADCVPIVLWNTEGTVMGLLHAGWRGVAENVLREGIQQAQKYYGVRASDLHLWFGPSIRACHYEITAGRARLFRPRYPTTVTEREGRLFLDLAGVLKTQAEALGILSDRVDTSAECTYHTHNEKGEYTYFSARRGSSVDRDEVMVTVAVLDM